MIGPACGSSSDPSQAPREDEQLRKIVVQVGWLLNGGIAPECSAILNGYYGDEGLDVELRPGGPVGTTFLISTNALATEPEIDIAIDNDIVSLLHGKTRSDDPDDQIKAKLFAAFWQDNPMGFLVRADSELHGLKDLAGTRPDGTPYVIGATAGTFILDALANYIGVDKDELNVVRTSFDASPFLTGKVDALFSFETTQAYEAVKAGIDYRFLRVSEIPGFSQPSYVALAREETLAEDPEMLESWLRATIKGARWVTENPDEAARQILDPACGGPQFDVEQERWLIGKSLPLMQYDGSYERLGYVDADQVAEFSRSYAGLGSIPRAPSADELVDLRILEGVYAE